MLNSTQAAHVEPESVIYRYFSAFERHALDEMLELLDENARCTYPTESHRNWQDRRAAGEVMRGYFSRFPDLKLQWKVERAEPEPCEGCEGVRRLIGRDSFRHLVSYESSE